MPEFDVNGYFIRNKEGKYYNPDGKFTLGNYKRAQFILPDDLNETLIQVIFDNGCNLSDLEIVEVHIDTAKVWKPKIIMTEIK